MPKLSVFVKGIYSGELEKRGEHDYTFRYDEVYRLDDSAPALCLNMPKSQSEYKSDCLFPVFANMLSEGYNRRLQSSLHQIDQTDDFALLALSGQYDTIGAITIKPTD